MEIRLKDHFCFRLYVASRLIIQGYGEELQPLGLTYPKYLVLLALLEKDQQTVRSLGELLSLDSGTLSPLLKALSKKGYVKRTRLTKDERTVVNTITPSGRTVCRRAKKIALHLFKQTEISNKAHCTLLTDMDDYVLRCKKILNKKRINQNLKKESLWKRKKSTERLSPLRSL